MTEGVKRACVLEEDNNSCQEKLKARSWILDAVCI